MPFKNSLKILMLLVWSLVFCMAQTFAQNPAPPKDWTPWAPTQGDWAEFYVFTNFRGGNKTPEQLARKDIKSLKVDCLILGRLRGELPPDLRGVKTVKVLYTEYGKFRGIDDFGEDSITLLYSGREQHVQQVTITRAASQFDADEAGKPVTVAEVLTTHPTKLSVMIGLEPTTKRKISGRKYRVPCEWRRKGNTVELRIKDYRPSAREGNNTNP